MALDLNDPNEKLDFMTALNNVLSGKEKLQRYQDIQFQHTQDSNPLGSLLVDKSLFTSSCVLISSATMRERVKSTASDGGREHSFESVEGSPLRLQTFDTPDAINGNINMKTNQSEHWPLSVDDARTIISLVDLEGDPELPICILCDGRDGEGNVVMSSFKKHGSTNGCVEYHQCVAKLTGPLTSRCRFPSAEDLIRELDIDNINVVETHCKSTYDIYKSSIEDNTLPEHQGSLRLYLEWKKVSQPLQDPPLDATAFVEAQIVPGDMRSAAHSLYSDIFLLKGLIGGLKTGVVYWNSAASDVPVHENLRAFISRLSGEPTAEANEDDKNTSPLEHLIMATRQNLDFTELLWDILKDCQCYQDLIDCLQIVLKALQSGSLQPMVHSRNQSQLAQLVRQAYKREMVPVSLSHPTPLHMLAEIGLDKLVKDHAHHLITKELVTMAQLTPFMALKEELGDRLMLLEKLHHTVELAVTLEQVLKLPKQAVSFGARQALKHFENNEVQEKPHTFHVPVQPKSIKAVISQLKPAEWHALITSKRSNLREYAAYHLTAQSPFPHCDISIQPDDEVDCDTTYFLTTVMHQIVEI